MFRYLVLGLLRNGDACHGYAVIKDYRKRTGQEASSGNFYRELQRLVGEGLVRTATNPPGADPRRAPYQITEAGSAVFDTWLFGSDGTSRFSLEMLNQERLSSSLLNLSMGYEASPENP